MITSDKAKRFKELIESKNQKRFRLKELEKRYAYVVQHPDLMDEAIDLKADIDSLKLELGIRIK